MYFAVVGFGTFGKQAECPQEIDGAVELLDIRLEAGPVGAGDARLRYLSVCATTRLAVGLLGRFAQFRGEKPGAPAL
jgi:hypothetical protein